VQTRRQFVSAALNGHPRGRSGDTLECRSAQWTATSDTLLRQPNHEPSEQPDDSPQHNSQDDQEYEGPGRSRIHRRVALAGFSRIILFGRLAAQQGNQVPVRIARPAWAASLDERPRA
jgi:hypothetical protein